MAAVQNKTTKNIGSDATTTPDHVIDRTAPAGSKNSLGAQSVRDGRPATDDSTVEAIDEEGTDITAR
jgi:formylmethanofuran:tetrahydromethanopterin formyltransferase